MNSQPDNDILWDYMDRLRWRLRRLPEKQTADILREIRQHMQDLVADYQAEGASPADAVRLAEEKFGSAEQVADKINWERHGRPTLFTIFYVLFYSISSVAIQHVQTPSIFSIAFLVVLGAAVGACVSFRSQASRYRKLTPQAMRKEYIIAAVAIIILLGSFLVGYFLTGRFYIAINVVIWTIAMLTSSIAIEQMDKVNLHGNIE